MRSVELPGSIGHEISTLQSIKNYLEVLKPRETGLLVFIGLCAAVVAGDGYISLITLFTALAAILFASASANGFTNYLDRRLDARMKRTSHRVLASRRIAPAQKVLPMLIVLCIAGLALAWFLHPYALIVDAVGTAAAVIYRKRVTCVFPQGFIASCAPVLMGWFAAIPLFNLEIGLLCILIGAWLPSHIWSVMVANRKDYMNAGICYFPLSISVKNAVRVIFGFSALLYATAIGLYFVGDFGWLYLAVANILGIVMLYGSARFMFSQASRDAWKLYKLSAFPFLGVLFLVMCLDIWFMG
ncbi:protoheme IX farnesyltransferase [Chloroflexota bacterium]